MTGGVELFYDGCLPQRWEARMDPFVTSLLDHLDRRIADVGAREGVSMLMDALSRRELETLRDERRWVLSYWQTAAVVRLDHKLAEAVGDRIRAARA